MKKIMKSQSVLTRSVSEAGVCDTIKGFYRHNLVNCLSFVKNTSLFRNDQIVVVNVT